MTIEKIKKMMDACYLAKRAWDMLPSLPQGVAPSYIHYLDIIEMLESRGVRVKVSDISETLNLPRPGVTRTVKEMEQKGYLRRARDVQDTRSLLVELTPAGQQLQQRAAAVPGRMACCMQLSCAEITQLRTILNKLLGCLQG